MTFPVKPALAIATFLGIVAAFPRVSHDLRNLDRDTVQSVLDFPPERLAAGEIQEASAPNVAEARLVDPSNALAGFYDSLERTEHRDPGAITRIVPYGGSPTTAESRAARFAHFRLPATGANAIEIRAAGGGPVRLFGIVLEKPGPGISYDSLGMNGAHVALLAHNFNEPHWAEQLQHRHPDL